MLKNQLPENIIERNNIQPFSIREQASGVMGYIINGPNGLKYTIRAI